MAKKKGRLDISDEMIAERRGGSSKMPKDMPKWMAKSIILIIFIVFKTTILMSLREPFLA